MDKKNKSIIIIVLVVIILILLGVLGWFILNNINDKKVVSQNEVKETKKELLCEKKIEFDSKEFKYTLSRDNDNLVMNLYDSKANFLIYSEEDVEFFTASKGYENKEDYCLYNTIKINSVNEDDKFQYITISWVANDALLVMSYKVYSVEGSEYEELVDLSRYKITGYVDSVTKEHVDNVRIKDNKIYVIYNDYNDYIEEMVYEFKNGTYTKNFTGNKNFEGIAGVR